MFVRQLVVDLLLRLQDEPETKNTDDRFCSGAFGPITRASLADPSKSHLKMLITSPIFVFNVLG